MNTFTIIFISLLGLSLLVELWLANRHIRHVRANRDAVPKAFHRKISLEDHRKAADYTIAHTRFGRIEDIYGTALLAVWTVGGGLEWLDRFVRGFGFNKTTPGLFLGDLVKKTLLLGVIGTPLAMAALWLMQGTGALWWVYVWL